MKRIREFSLYLLLIAVLTVSLSACSTLRPEDTVNGYLTAAKQFDSVKMATYVNPNSTSTSPVLDDASAAPSSSSDKIEQFFMDYLKVNAAKMTYKIQSTEIDKDTAKVSVDCKYVDSTPLLTSVISEYFKQALSLAFSGSEMTDEQTTAIMESIITEQLKSITDTYIEKTIVINCVKIDGKWLIDSPSDDLQNVIMSNFLSASKDIASSFGGNSSDNTSQAN